MMARKARSSGSKEGNSGASNGSGGGSLTGLSMAALHSELRRRERLMGGMTRRRTRLAARLTKLDAEIRELGGQMGGARGGGRTRPKNDSNLAQALAKVLKGKQMGVTEVAEAVQRAGYQTTAANFRTIVNQTLIKNRNLFKKVSRGQYTGA